MKEELLKINESCDSNNGISSQRQTLVFFLTFEIFEHRKGLRRFPRFFKLLLEFFLVEYRFEAIYSNSIQETIDLWSGIHLRYADHVLRSFGLVRDIYDVIRCFVTCTIHATIRAIAPIDRKWNDAVFVRRYPSEFDYSAGPRN